MPMSRNRGSGSGPFLMEMVIAAGFFMLCVAMCLSAFVQADRLSKNGRDLNRAVLAAESLVEEVKAGNTENFGNSVPDDNFQKIFERSGCKCNVSVHRKQRRYPYIPGSMG
mgnify:CR=1 FL=1